jgi:hypothetical protein
VVWDRFDKNNPNHKKPGRADDEEDKDIDDDDDLGEEWDKEKLQQRIISASRGSDETVGKQQMLMDVSATFSFL